MVNIKEKLFLTSEEVTSLKEKIKSDLLKLSLLAYYDSKREGIKGEERKILRKLSDIFRTAYERINTLKKEEELFEYINALNQLILFLYLFSSKR